GSSLQRNDAGVWLCEYPGLSFQRSPVCACSLVSSLLLSGATMSQQSSLTQSAHSVRQVLTAYSSGLPRDALNRAHNALIGSAAAEVRAHMRDNLRACRLGILLEQVGRAHDLSGLAIATLRHLLGEPGLLQRVRRIRRQSFDRGHGLACDLRDLGLARKRALAVDMHHAGAAQTGSATELSPGELQPFPDHPQ